MVFFESTLKAFKIEQARKNYNREKSKSTTISKVWDTNHNVLKEIYIQSNILFARINKALQNCIFVTTNLKTFCIATISINKTVENKIFKSIVGFSSGIFLTYILFLFFLIHIKFTLSSATLFCSLLGIVLTITFAFSSCTRCIMFLLFLQVFSKRGRQALIAYAFIIMLTGPTNNTLHNVQVLSESLSCGQEELKQVIKILTNFANQPFVAFRHALTKMIKILENVKENIENLLTTIRKFFLSLYSVIKSAYNWLESIVNLCNKKFGTPYDRCRNGFEIAIADCQAKLGPLFNSFCEIANTVQSLCFSMKPLEFVCILTSLLQNIILDTLQKNIKNFLYQIKIMFYVKIEFSHFSHFEVNKTNFYENIISHILKDVESQTHNFLIVFNSMRFVTSFFFLCVLLRVVNYRHKWLTKDCFNNKYLTEDFYNIDLIRTQKSKDVVLPLDERERKKYITFTSTTLSSKEKTRLAKSTIFLGIASFKFCINMFVDHSLYWILSTINYYGRFSNEVQQRHIIGFQIAGNGYMSEIYRDISKIFLQFERNDKNSTFLCLPDPLSPNYRKYNEIIIIVIFSWMVALFEPFGLRLSQLIMSRYYPRRAKHRAVWLYNHILRSRGNYLNYIRRKLRQKKRFIDGNYWEYNSSKEFSFRTNSISNNNLRNNQEICLLCGVSVNQCNLSHIRCTTSNCDGIFCEMCLADLHGRCTICNVLIKSDDLSNVSGKK
ncbi:DC-STAMP domain-containing protein 2-like [Microplitis mediator]|uniref:DC-STAMP domain-containing protein 2-like n=1 Tax=Microplitis mediator TaxID=375433 RepID=UPI002556E574|nr:DC-STAMP domain-containing protein 2-like [Microplitis mediator]